MTIDRRMFIMSSALAMATPALSRTSRAPDTVSVHSPFLTIEGRTADMPGGIARAAYPGVVVRARFNGPKLVLAATGASDNQWVDIIVDGGTRKVVHLDPAAHDLVVFDGASGEHTVEIARRNESWQGVWDIAGASTPGGHFLPPPLLPRKKLLFIGDSVTCGGASDVRRDETRQDLSTDDGQNSYGKVLARALQAQCHLVSGGGRGLIRDYKGDPSGTAPIFYELAAPDEPTKPWNHASYVPDAVGVMLGTNDFNLGIPDQNDFVNAFVQFIEKIRRDAPRATVFLMDSPIVTNDDLPKRMVLGAYIDEVVRRVASPLVMHAPVSHYPGRATNPHPIAEDHVKIAQELEPLFRKALA